MSYRVVWLPDAEQELAALRLDTQLRAEVTRAAHALDLQLQQDPDALGESRAEDWRIHFEPPLGILFHIDPRRRQVEVTHVWIFR